LRLNFFFLKNRETITVDSINFIQDVKVHNWNDSSSFSIQVIPPLSQETQSGIPLTNPSLNPKPELFYAGINFGIDKNGLARKRNSCSLSFFFFIYFPLLINK